jgi:hypothetical protein
MSDVMCTNDQCSEYQIPKDNSLGNFPAEDIRCGQCGGPVEEVPDEAPA